MTRDPLAGRADRIGARAANAYARGLWVRETLADSLARAARLEPARVLLVDGARRIDSQTLLTQAQAIGIVDLGTEAAPVVTETDPQRVKQLALDYLKSRALPVPEQKPELDLTA